MCQAVAVSQWAPFSVPQDTGARFARPFKSLR